MATSKVSTTVMCIMCNRAKGIYKCEGCSRNFCPRHSIDHRSELGKQLEKIEVIHDLVHQTLIQQTKDPRQHPLVKIIDQWEKDSVLKVRQTAEETRSELLKSTSQYTSQVKQKFQQLTIQLKHGRDKNDFSEIDLQQWTQKLEELKKELLSPVNIAIEGDPTPLITKLRIDRQDVTEVFRTEPEHRYEAFRIERQKSYEAFRIEQQNKYDVFRISRRNTLDVLERSHSHVRIEENGRLVIKDSLNNHTEVRGKKEYNFGRHTLRFRIENLSGNSWLFFGIISKSEPIRGSSFKSSSSYGWAIANQIYVSGVNIGGSTIEINQNDTIILLIDCDKRKIELKNERTNRTMEMSVDASKCSFPWQLHLNLHTPNTRLRILSPSD
jgi:hypothetical protein